MAYKYWKKERLISIIINIINSIMRQIDILAEPLLLEHGFTLKNTTWYRATGEVLQLINFQKNPWGADQYYLNTALTFCSKSIKEMGRTLPKEYQCPIRFRSETLPETKRYVFVLDFEKDIPNDIREYNVLKLLAYWLSFFDDTLTRESVINKIKTNSIDKRLVFYSFRQEHDLI